MSLQDHTHRHLTSLPVVVTDSHRRDSTTPPTVLHAVSLDMFGTFTRFLTRDGLVFNEGEATPMTADGQPGQGPICRGVGGFNPPNDFFDPPSLRRFELLGGRF